MLICTAKNLRCLKSLKQNSFKLKYKHHKNSSMHTNITTLWYVDIFITKIEKQETVIKDNGKVLLILDNALLLILRECWRRKTEYLNFHIFHIIFYLCAHQMDYDFIEIFRRLYSRYDVCYSQINMRKKVFGVS